MQIILIEVIFPFNTKTLYCEICELKWFIPLI